MTTQHNTQQQTTPTSDNDNTKIKHNRTEANWSQFGHEVTRHDMGWKIRTHTRTHTRTQTHTRTHTRTQTQTQSVAMNPNLSEVMQCLEMSVMQCMDAMSITNRNHLKTQVEFNQILLILDNFAFGAVQSLNQISHAHIDTISTSSYPHRIC